MNVNFLRHQLIPTPLPYECLLPIKKVMIQIRLVVTFMKENMTEVRICDRSIDYFDLAENVWGRSIILDLLSNLLRNCFLVGFKFILYL